MQRGRMQVRIVWFASGMIVASIIWLVIINVGGGQLLDVLIQSK
jgi:hypothetical protein